MTQTLKERHASAVAKFQTAKIQLHTANSRLQIAKRKRENRQKIITGALLLKLVAQGDPQATLMRERILENVSEKDRSFLLEEA